MLKIIFHATSGGGWKNRGKETHRRIMLDVKTPYSEVIETFLFGVYQTKWWRYEKKHKKAQFHNKMMMLLICFNLTSSKLSSMTNFIVCFLLLICTWGWIDNQASLMPTLKSLSPTLSVAKRIFNNMALLTFKDNYFNYALCSVINACIMFPNLIF